MLDHPICAVGGNQLAIRVQQSITPQPKILVYYLRTRLYAGHAAAGGWDPFSDVLLAQSAGLPPGRKLRAERALRLAKPIW
nr:hypothetical protein [Micromonospora echinospora]